MDYLDKLIPLATLGAVCALMLFLLRRAAREKEAAQRSEYSPTGVEVPADPLSGEEPATVMVMDPVVVLVQKPVAQVKSEVLSPTISKREEENAVTANVVPAGFPPQGPAPSEKPKRKKRTPTPAPATPSVPTPIVTVMGLLQEKDSLAAAFLLREILAPPVSRRH